MENMSSVEGFETIVFDKIGLKRVDKDEHSTCTNCKHIFPSKNSQETCYACYGSICSHCLDECKCAFIDRCGRYACTKCSICCVYCDSVVCEECCQDVIKKVSGYSMGKLPCCGLDVYSHEASNLYYHSKTGEYVTREL